MNESKSLLITGSGRGLGRDLALRFAGDSAHIIITGKDKDRLFKVREEIIHPQWANCDAVVGDIMEEETIKDLAVLSEQIDLDILINNVGVRSAGSFSSMDEQDIDKMIKVNLLSIIKLTKAIYPIFIKKKSGMIININSIAGKSPNSDEAVYCASKYGLRGFFDSFRFEAREHNIKILNIYLGAMNTKMTDGRDDQEFMISPLEVAQFVYTLCMTYHKSFEIPEIDLWRNRNQRN